MIVGSGMLANAFANENENLQEICIYAAGVSNSNCLDPKEFERERQRLAESLNQFNSVKLFVYFGTCSVYDSEAADTPYVKHKIAMEKMVEKHSNAICIRLPQVCGNTPNPHTLLNFLYARIARSEGFKLWGLAKRNIIDVEDVSKIAMKIFATQIKNTTINIANPINHSLLEIVREMELVVGKKAIFDMVDRGTQYHIETCSMMDVLEKSEINFNENYIKKVIKKYYSSIK